MNLLLLDKKTGEKFDIVLDKKMVQERVAALTDEQKSYYLTCSNYIRKAFGLIEKTIKDYVKDLDLEFDDNGVAMFENWKVKRASRASFDKKRFEQEATEKEKEVIEEAEQIKQRYMKTTQYERMT